MFCLLAKARQNNATPFATFRKGGLVITIGDLVFKIIRYPRLGNKKPQPKRKKGKKIQPDKSPPKYYTEIYTDWGVGIVVKEIPEGDGIPTLYKVRWSRHPITSSHSSENLLVYTKEKIVYADGKCVAKGKDLEKILEQMNDKEVKRIAI